MAESLDSDTLNATTCVSCAFSNFTISSIAPTLFGRKTENCRTSGPLIFEVVSGKSIGIGMGRERRKLDAARPQSISLSIFSLQTNIGAVVVALAPPLSRFG